MDAGPANKGTRTRASFATINGGHSPLNVGKNATTGTPDAASLAPTVTSGIYTFQMPASYVGNDCGSSATMRAGLSIKAASSSPSYLTGKLRDFPGGL